MATIQQITSDPRFQKATPEQKKRLVARAEDAPQSFKDAVLPAAKQAVDEALFREGTVSRDAATNPVTQAKMLPALAGPGAAAAGIPMGMTLGTVGGRQLSNAALRVYGKPEEVPSGLSQALEGALSVAGDLKPIPAINKIRFGKQIGQAEKLAGVPPVQDIPSTPMALGQKTIGEYVNEAVDSVKSSGQRGTPVYWKQMKDQIKRIYELGKESNLTDLDKGRLKWLSAMVQDGLNKAVPGRAAASQAYALSQTVPNVINEGWRAIPKSVKWGMGVGSGAGGAGGLAYQLGRRAGGDRGQ